MLVIQRRTRVNMGKAWVSPQLCFVTWNIFRYIDIFKLSVSDKIHTWLKDKYSLWCSSSILKVEHFMVACDYSDPAWELHQYGAPPLQWKRLISRCDFPKWTDVNLKLSIPKINWNLNFNTTSKTFAYRKLFCGTNRVLGRFHRLWSILGIG